MFFINTFEVSISFANSTNTNVKYPLQSNLQKIEDFLLKISITIDLQIKNITVLTIEISCRIILVEFGN